MCAKTGGFGVLRGVNALRAVQGARWAFKSLRRSMPSAVQGTCGQFNAFGGSRDLRSVQCLRRSRDLRSCKEPPARVRCKDLRSCKEPAARVKSREPAVVELLEHDEVMIELLERGFPLRLDLYQEKGGVERLGLQKIGIIIIRM